MMTAMKEWMIFTQGCWVAAVCLLFCGTAHAGFQDIQSAIIQEDFTTAEKLAREVIDRQPPVAELNEARYYLGLSQLGLGQYGQARETFQQLQDPSPTLGDRAAVGIIDSYTLEGEYTQALKEAERLLQSRKNSELLSLIYYKVARANLKLAKWDRARKFLAKITEEFPQSPEQHLAKQLLQEKQFFSVQIGSFLNRQRAENLAAELQGNGEYAYIVETIDKENRLFYRVRVGQLASLEEAQSLKHKIAQLGYPTRIYP